MSTRLEVQSAIEQLPKDEIRNLSKWLQEYNAPLILGHMNFLLEFDVCFYRSELAFEISPRKY